MIASPCKDCPDRHTYCHANCEKYKEFAKKKRAETVKTNKEKASLSAMWSYNGRDKRKGKI